MSILCDAFARHFLLPARLCFVKHEVANNYSEAEVYEVTTTSTTIVLLAISFFLKRHGHIDSGNEIQALPETYGPALDGAKASTPRAATQPRKRVSATFAGGRTKLFVLICAALVF